MQAQSISDALACLDERAALIFDKRADIPRAASPDFYINRPDNPLDELKSFLIHTPGDCKVLFTGHLGSGKSTELNRLVVDEELQKKFFIVKYSIHETINILEIDYIDFLISFLAKLFLSASESKQELISHQTMSLLVNWTQLFKKEVGSYKGGSEQQKSNAHKGKVFSFFKGISAILLREVSLREKIREIVQRNISQLVDLINAQIMDIRTNLQTRDLLVVIDDLEKIPDIQKAETLFIKAGTFLTMPQCKIVYTVPLALFYSLQFQQLVNIFGNSYFLPNIKIREKGKETGKIDPSGCMREFIAKRLAEGLIDKRAADMAIEHSAGVARELVRILNLSCNKALTKKLPAITPDIVQLVVQELRNEYERGLEKRHYDVLRLVAACAEVEDTHTLMELYHNKAILEYKNGTRWTAINPIVKPLIKKE